MKTAKYIKTMLMIFAISSTALTGQTASRGDRTATREQVQKATRIAQPSSRLVNKNPVSKKQEIRKVTPTTSRTVYQQPQRRSTTPTTSRTVHQQPQRGKTSNPVGRVGNSQAYNKGKTVGHTRVGTSGPRIPGDRNNARQEALKGERPTSISSRRNPGSTYRSPGSKVYAKERARYENKRYYSGRHYHHVYPYTRVRVNHHYDARVHNYRVLYRPAYREIYWTRNMYRDYRLWYPNYYWRYNYGYRIQTISVFDAKYNLGEVAMVYGRVSATWYNEETDDYLLFFGGEYPYHQFTIVLPGRIARKFNWRPERYFLGEHLTVTGLITTYDGIPEIIVKNGRQIGLY